ncbi:MAG TPA: PEP-CTERM/exosortase system-associated acyltransferase [Candidatus Competibacteraceae bacterium]|nr:PEP-CTERM/exosortase system-associated acyltransferase [Candidatus Competibacteraceae bacterium]MCP5133861.1 PEP-CTERM/exosortase system-associated acyltransferase [Gammaproteobacteria bacterium]HPF58800.1 PEP-CTERM/exosortase system-associated acyltransferase [Candidatus Competibacteraceae bacterium]
MFDHAYEVILADTEASRAIHRKIRYQVYCQERRFEDPAEFPNGEEYDVWDIHAAHFIVRHRATATWVAAVRLVLPDAFQFPVETLHCLSSEQAQCRPRRELAEVSRICIINAPAPWKMNRHLDYQFGHAGRSGEHDILLGMVNALIIYGLHRGIECFHLLISQSFARLLKRLGVILQQVGNTIDYHGLRIPYQADIRETSKSLVARSALFRGLFSRRELAYQSFSALDGVWQEFEMMPPSFDWPPAPETARRSEIPLSVPSHPGVWHMEAERSRPGPGVWRSVT